MDTFRRLTDKLEILVSYQMILAETRERIWTSYSYIYIYSAGNRTCKSNY